MPLSCEFHIQNDCLVVTASGKPESPEEFFTYIKASVMKARASGLYRILFDETKTDLKFNVHEAVLMSDLLDQAGLQHLGIQGAVVCRAHDLAAAKYFETALRNRSFNVMMFDNISEGQNWLHDGDSVVIPE